MPEQINSEWIGLAEEQTRIEWVEWIESATDNGIIVVSVHDGSPRDDLHPGPGLWLKDGRDIPCQIVGTDELGNYSVLTEEGQTLQFFFDEVF